MQREAHGWHLVPTADEAAIEAAWTAHIQPGAAVVVPKPSRTWRGESLAKHRQHPGLEADFSLKLLTAFRRCVPPGERLWVIDWQHAWYSLNPHAAEVSGWPVRSLPDGDSYNFVTPDFRLGVIMGWRATGPVTLFGSPLLSAFAADPPEEFLRVCGPGVQDAASP